MSQSAGIQLLPSGKLVISKYKRDHIMKFVRIINNRLIDNRMYTGRVAQMTEMEVVDICVLLCDVLSEEPACLSITMHSDLYVVGDLYGHHNYLLQLFDALGHPPGKRYLFLGNYVNRSDRSLETLMLLYTYKLMHPNSIYLIRGNHESDQLGRSYGFYQECTRRFSAKLWDIIMTTFNYLPLTALLDKRVFCSHSGISPSLLYSGLSGPAVLQEYINAWIPRPSEIEANLLSTHFTWSEPNVQVKEWKRNPAGLAYLFGASVVSRFCQQFGLLQMVRSNELLPEGFEFFTDPHLVTIFTLPDYMGVSKNNGAILSFNREQDPRTLMGRVITIKPILSTRGKLIGRTALVLEDSIGGKRTVNRRLTAESL